MSTQQKNRPIRQFSMRSETPTLELRRKTLKKQFSQDLPDRKPPETRNIQSAKTRTKIIDETPTIKLAWAEDIKTIQDIYKKEDSIVVKKCKEVKRPLTTKSKQNLLNKESILQTRQEFADHLRQVWKERDGVKQNLNIFLTHVTHEDCHDMAEKENANTELLSEREKPKIILPLKPTTFVDEGDLKNAFQKQIRKTKRNSATLSPRMPLKHPTPSETVLFQEKDKTPKENATMSIVLRPHTAAAKRESFQKRTNSAFNGSLTRNPLLMRTSSLPTKTENTKPKFVATKKRLKSAKRCSKDDVAEQKVTTTLPSCDIVTMVSLMSNSESEEDESEDEDNKSEIKKDVEKEKDLSLRKIVKTVSFQQSTIHTVRSFSASFPGRRSSLFLKDQQKMQEKRTTTDAVQDEDESTAKRRLLRTGSRRQESFEDLTTLSADEKQEESDSKPQLDTQKEKQCWELYKKMCEKGVTVSFDTILRGMLTPTEYRLHRKQSLVEQDNC